MKMTRKTKIIAAVLGLGGIAAWFLLRPKTLSAATLPGLTTLNPAATMAQSVALAVGNGVPLPSGVTLPAGVPANVRVLGYYTPPGAKSFNTIVYGNSGNGVYYFYNVNQGTVKAVGPSIVKNYVNTPGWKAAA